MVVMANTVAVAANTSSFPMAMATQKPLLMLSTSSLSFPARLSSFLPISPTSSFLTPAVSSPNAGLNSSDLQEDEKKKKSKYYFLAANAKFMLDEEEHFQEQMFERLRLFGERNLEQDFWLVIEPKFLDKFPNITKRLKRPAVALVSTNGPWITFMKLRLDRVLSESFEADSLEQALASNPTEIRFDKPDNWVAPYAKYEYGWWEAFLPPASHESLV